MSEIDTNKLLLGKMLGEIYRIQSNTDIPCGASKGKIFGLLNGFENVIDEEIEAIGYITKKQLNATIKILNPIYDDPIKLSEFKGFYDIEDKLAAVGVDRSDAIRILMYLYADNKFTAIINKMNSSGSPVECCTFDLSEWDK